ncbi:MAG: hypothetical protein GY821_12930 [Gammaproteobacteria bacterium]|nr:hypothetical protein [Gammaproteobacteria bacterium]
MEAPCLVYLESFQLFRIFALGPLAIFFKMASTAPEVSGSGIRRTYLEQLPRLGWLAAQAAQFDELNLFAP